MARDGMAVSEVWLNWIEFGNNDDAHSSLPLKGELSRLRWTLTPS